MKKSVFLIAASFVSAWLLYGLCGHRLIKRFYHSDSSVLADALMPGRTSTSVARYLREADRRMLQSSFWAAALLTFVVASRRPVVSISVCACVLVFFTLSVFAVDVSPFFSDLLNLQSGYYGSKRTLIPDATLVYRMRPFLHLEVAGDEWVVDEDGFRNHRMERYADVMILGDGMVNSGRTPQDSMAARLEHHLRGRIVRSLAVSGYGPPQAVEALRKFGLKRKPRIAVLAFTEGNDLQDIARYWEWKSGAWPALMGGYEVSITDPLLKLRQASAQTWRQIEHAAFERTAGTAMAIFGSDAFGYLPDNTAFVRLPTGTTFRTLFIDKLNTKTSAEIQDTAEWQQLRETLRVFKTTCLANHIIPVVMFVPATAHIYAQDSTSDSGSDWLEIRDEQIQARDNLENALAEQLLRMGIHFVNPRQLFESAAKAGRQLYDPHTVHMNAEGTDLAAAYLAKDLIKNFRLDGPPH